MGDETYPTVSAIRATHIKWTVYASTKAISTAKRLGITYDAVSTQHRACGDVDSVQLEIQISVPQFCGP